MNRNRYAGMAVVGTVMLVGSLSAAWTVGRNRVAVEPVPMEELLETAAWEESSQARWEVWDWDLPVTRNERVDFWIDFLSGRNAERTRLWLERQGRYGPLIRSELRSRGMPEDLLYLALIESGLSPKAYSRAAASGLWQFIAETGRRYGLAVTTELDERRDPIRSTSAALTYLEELYGRFGSWYLAAAAYNTGENRVGRIMRQMFGTERGTDEHFWRIAHRLPRETRDYVPLMLAAGHIAKDPEQYGFDGLEYQAPLAFDDVHVPGGTDLSLVARAAGVEASAVTDLNPHLTRGRTPSGGEYVVRVPRGSRVAFDAAFPELQRLSRLAAASVAPAAGAASAAGSSSARTHRVRSGETLSHIARRYGVSVNALRSANGNVDPRRLRPGQTLRVPGSGAAASPSRATAVPRMHQVRRGENLTVIARRYGVTVRQLRTWNNLSGSRIYAGQRLRVS